MNTVTVNGEALDPGRDFEIVFVDDTSPDGTSAVVRAIGEGDRRVRWSLDVDPQEV